jgi:hypothetical protein
MTSYRPKWWENDRIIFPQFSIYGEDPSPDANQNHHPSNTSSQHDSEIPLHALYVDLATKYQDLQQQIQSQEQEREAQKHPERALYVGDEEEGKPSQKHEEDK